MENLGFSPVSGHAEFVIGGDLDPVRLGRLGAPVQQPDQLFRRGGLVAGLNHPPNEPGVDSVSLQPDQLVRGVFAARSLPDVADEVSADPVSSQSDDVVEGLFPVAGVRETFQVTHADPVVVETDDRLD